MKEERKTQSDIYRKAKDVITVAKFHEEMFFNELIKGLWNYGYIDRYRKPSQISKSGFMTDLKNNNMMYHNNNSLVAKNRIPAWGHGIKEGIIKYTDIAHSVQARHVNEMANYYKSSHKNQEISFLEIGSGFGGLAEKLLLDCKFRKIILFDIPHNLVTAYYYLSQTNVQSGKIELASSISKFTEYFEDSYTKVILCPTCFYDTVKTLKDNFIVGNFGSFSEMNRATIEYYLKGIPNETQAIININSNQKLENAGSHIEVIADEFAIPERFSVVYSGPSVCQAACNNRYKTTIHMKYR